MIIVKTPLRIPIAGGGTDISLWYKDYGSMFISAAIDKFIYITLHHSGFSKKIRCRYSIMEEVDKVDDIKNEIIRETLKRNNIKDSIEITSHAEIPNGTGLGSSGSFGVGLYHALNPRMTSMELACQATLVQIDLGFPIGWQDQLVAAFGGIFGYTIKMMNENVMIDRFEVRVNGLEENLALFFTGYYRDANEVLKQSSLNGLDVIQKLAHQTKDAFEKKNYDEYGRLMNEHWEFKKKRGRMTNPQIDEWYECGLKNGAIGGKLIGAGGGGFLLFYTKEKQRLINAMPIKHIPFKFYQKGSEIIC